VSPRDELASQSRGEQARGGASRLPYSAPKLTVLGDVRDLTMGGSPGIGDSGNATIQQPPV
jgi:hypothetical protein